MKRAAIVLVLLAALGAFLFQRRSAPVDRASVATSTETVAPTLSQPQHPTEASASGEKTPEAAPHAATVDVAKEVTKEVTKDQAAQAAVSTKAASAMHAGAHEPVQSQYENLRVEVLKAIPTTKDLSKLSNEEVHMTPALIVHASDEIGKMAQLMADHPELSQSGLAFYRECAEQNDSPKSVRAACFANFQELAKKSGLSSAAPKVPKAVSDLAQKIM